MPPIIATVGAETFRVRSYEVDPTGRVSIQNVCNYLQEIAANHARSLGFSVGQLLGPDLTWVLSRLHVQMDRYPEWGDEVRVETWPSGVEGLFAHREFLIYHTGDEPIGRGSSAWLLVDVNRRRPVRMPELITGIVRPERPRPIPDAFPKLDPPARKDHERRFSVRYSDLDVNAHVNNVRYVEWAVETIPQELLQGHRLTHLEVAFKAETTYPDFVVGEAERTGEAGAPSFLHRVSREADGKEAAVLRTRWTPG